MISAEEARKLMPRTLDTKLEDLGRRIEELAKMGESKIRTDRNYKLDYSFWNSDTPTDEHQDAINKLENLGYSVIFCKRYEYGGPYTIIKW